MIIKKKTVLSIVLSIALVVVLAFGALSLGGCTKKNANQNSTNNGTTTTTTNKNGGVTLETSATVHVDIPKGQ
ncbi:MAG: hypothetical protein FWF45_03420 [Coriobacteriia bacterium]|nr:hypothetical protein [Coriobacteriia bacterium]